MIKSRSVLVVVAVITVLVLSACSNSTRQSTVSMAPSQSTGHIYLYGEMHDLEEIKNKEIELWSEYYNNQGMRHLFIESAYYIAEFLNIWMQSDSDEILDILYSDIHPDVVNKVFYKKIKSECPETIFHGIDIGHNQAEGEMFLKYLKDNNLEDSEQYHLTLEAIEQGNYYYKTYDDGYRENMMVENFIYEFDKLSDESIMGIYGAAHIIIEESDDTNSVLSMATQLKKRYEDSLHCEDLNEELFSFGKDMDPYTIDAIKVGGKDYRAAYFGEQNLFGYEGLAYREFWRLEKAYDDFKDSPTAEDQLPYANYPMVIEAGQIFMIDYTKTDGSVIRKYYRSVGDIGDKIRTTEEFTIE